MSVVGIFVTAWVIWLFGALALIAMWLHDERDR